MLDIDPTKLSFIESFFEALSGDVRRAIELVDSEKYHLEGITVLCCLIAALSRYRYPQEDNKAAFKQVISDYSDQQVLYQNIDLLFFNEWQQTVFAGQKPYKKLKNYEEIKDILSKHYEGGKYSTNRYQTPLQLLETLKADSDLPNTFDAENFSEHIRHFSNLDIFYKYIRCPAVHENDFPLFDCRIQQDSSNLCGWRKTCTPITEVTPDVMKKTAMSIVNNLKAECMRECKWAAEL